MWSSATFLVAPMNFLPPSLPPSLIVGVCRRCQALPYPGLSLSPFLRLKNCSTGAHLSINVAGIGTGAKVATATATGAAAVAQSLHSFLYFPLSVFCFQFSASVFTVLTMCRYLPLAGRFHVSFRSLLLLLLLELSTHSQTTWITLSATKMQQLKANELRTANCENWWHIKHLAKFNELSEFPSPAGDESWLSSVWISFVFNQYNK